MNNLSIQQLKSISPEAIKEIERLYPYFLLPKMLRLKKYFLEKHPDYQPLLHKTAVFSYNREALYDFLHGEEQAMIPSENRLLQAKQEEPDEKTTSAELSTEVSSVAPIFEQKTTPVEIKAEIPVENIVTSTPVEDEIEVPSPINPLETEKQEEQIETMLPSEKEIQFAPAIELTPEVAAVTDNKEDREENALLGESISESNEEAATQEPIVENNITESKEETRETELTEVHNIETLPLTSLESAPDDEIILELPASNIRDIEATIYNNLKDILETNPTQEASVEEHDALKEEKAPEIDQDLLKEASENSFLQWLKIVEKKKIAEKKIAEDQLPKPKLKIELTLPTEKINVKKDPELEALDGFVKDQIKRKKKKNPNILEIPFDQTIIKSTEQQDIVSEGLAKLLHNQGKYERAIEMYQKLILKYPEKSAFFASQIDLIKDLYN